MAGDEETLRVGVTRLVDSLAALPPPPACDACGAMPAAALKKCGRCRAARYCGADCQRAAWRTHKAACDAAAARLAA
jgi:hypothetical protein